jgi:hypothetical protein
VFAKSSYGLTVNFANLLGPAVITFKIRVISLSSIQTKENELCFTTIGHQVEQASIYTQIFFDTLQNKNW